MNLLPEVTVTLEMGSKNSFIDDKDKSPPYLDEHFGYEQLLFESRGHTR